jgi:hypothetical protein
MQRKEVTELINDDVDDALLSSEISPSSDTSSPPAVSTGGDDGSTTGVEPSPSPFTL